MDPITIAMALAQFAPIITKWITGSDKDAAVATQIVGIAQTVTGRQGNEALSAIAADPALALKFQEAVLVNENDLDKAFLLDRQNARARDAAIFAAGKHNYRADTMYVLAVLVIIGLVYVIWKDPDVNEYMKGIVTLVLGRFLGYLDNIYNFEFGTTRSSQAKNGMIDRLTK